MAQYRLHYAGSTFDLPDAKAATELARKIQQIQQGRVGARLNVQTANGVVLIFVGPFSQIAVSADGSAEPLDGERPVGVAPEL